MKATNKIIKYTFLDLLRSKWLLLYALFFILITDTLFRFGGGSERVILSLMNVILFIIPLVSIIFGLIYIYNSREFLEMMLSQPVARVSLYSGLYLGLVVPLMLAFMLGVGVPFWLHAAELRPEPFGMLIGAGISLTLIFTALAFVLALRYEEKVKGFGITLLAWLIFAVLYDGLVLFIAIYYQDYPLEKPLIALSLLNPIDLARILLLLQSDFSALMGYTGAIFHKFFGSSLGILVASMSLLAWAAAPFAVGMRLFAKKDF